MPAFSNLKPGDIDKVAKKVTMLMLTRRKKQYKFTWGRMAVSKIDYEKSTVLTFEC